MTKHVVNGMLLGIVLVCAGYFFVAPPLERMANNWIEKKIEERIAGIALNAPTRDENAPPMLDGYQLNRQPSP